MNFVTVELNVGGTENNVFKHDDNGSSRSTAIMRTAFDFGLLNWEQLCWWTVSE